MRRWIVASTTFVFSFSGLGRAEDLGTPAESPSARAAETRDDSSRWDTSWDSGMLFLPPLGSLDVLYRHRVGELGEEHCGFLTLNFPLERFTSRSKEGGATQEVTPEQERGDIVVTEPVVEEARASREVVEPDTSIRASLALARALAASIRDSAPERAAILEIDAAQSRSRTSGVLPELRLRGAHGFDQSVAPSSSGVYGAPVATRGGWDTAFEVRLTFRLARLLYDDGESSLISMKHKLAALIEARVDDALGELAKFEAARKRLSLAGLDDEDRVKALVSREDALVRLDRLAGGQALALIEKHLGPRALVVGEPPPATPEIQPN